MQITRLDIEGLLLIELVIHADSAASSSSGSRSSAFAKRAPDSVHARQSAPDARPGVLRGLHYQHTHRKASCSASCAAGSGMLPSTSGRVLPDVRKVRSGSRSWSRRHERMPALDAARASRTASASSATSPTCCTRLTPPTTRWGRRALPGTTRLAVPGRSGSRSCRRVTGLCQVSSAPRAELPGASPR